MSKLAAPGQVLSHHAGVRPSPLSPSLSALPPPLRRWQNQAIGRTCSSGASNCIIPLAQILGATTQVSTFIAAGGFMFLNDLSTTFVSNFTYQWPAGNSPQLANICSPPHISDVQNNKSPETLSMTMSMTQGSWNVLSQTNGDTASSSTGFGNTYSKTQTLSFAPPKMPVSVSSSSTNSQSSSSSWGYSSEQQTSYSTGAANIQTTSWTFTNKLYYGNVDYLIGQQYYGSLSAVTFSGINTLTFKPCQTLLCQAVNGGAYPTLQPKVNQIIFGHFTGQSYSAASIVSARSLPTVLCPCAYSPPPPPPPPTHPHPPPPTPPPTPHPPPTHTHTHTHTHTQHPTPPDSSVLHELYYHHHHHLHSEEFEVELHHQYYS